MAEPQAYSDYFFGGKYPETSGLFDGDYTKFSNNLALILYTDFAILFEYYIFCIPTPVFKLPNPV